MQLQKTNLLLRPHIRSLSSCYFKKLKLHHLVTHSVANLMKQYFINKLFTTRVGSQADWKYILFWFVTGVVWSQTFDSYTNKRGEEPPWPPCCVRHATGHGHHNCTATLPSAGEATTSLTPPSNIVTDHASQLWPWLLVPQPCRALLAGNHSTPLSTSSSQPARLKYNFFFHAIDVD